MGEAAGKLKPMLDERSLPEAIAVVTVDRLPAWILPAYGSTWVAMPNLDALAGRGIVFDRVLATTDDAMVTLACMAGAGTGSVIPPSLPALELAHKRGWNPALVTDDARFAKAIHAPTEICLVSPNEAQQPAADESDSNLGRLFASATGLMKAGQHRMVWCHAASLGISWDAPHELRNRYVDPDDPPPPPNAAVPNMRTGKDTDPDTLVGIRHVFAGQLTLLDRCLAPLLEAIATRSERWMILVAGVRGLGLGLHGTVGCDPMPPYSELMQLSAILFDDRERMAGQRHAGLVTPADIGATLLDRIGFPVERSRDARVGRSLAGLVDGWKANDRDRVISRSARGVAVVTPSWHLVQPLDDDNGAGPTSLFAKPDDFFEACDVGNRCPAIVEELTAIALTDSEQAWHTPLSHEAMAGL